MYPAPELEDWNREQNKAPITQGESASELLHPLDTHKSMEPDGIHTGTEGTGRSAQGVNSHHLSAILHDQGGHSGPEVSKLDAQLQEAGRGICRATGLSAWP